MEYMTLELFLKGHPTRISTETQRQILRLHRQFEELRPTLNEFMGRDRKRARRTAAGATAGGVAGMGLGAAAASARRRRKETRSRKR
jgi:hypothetical protein